MTEVLWPPDLIPSSQTWNILGNATSFVSPFTGSTRTYGRPGSRMGCTITLPPLKGQDRARIISVIASLRDRSNRIWIPDFSNTRRGSFSASELLTNNDFSNGTTSWSAQSAGTAPTLSASDRVLRVTARSSDEFPQAYQAATVSQYAPYAARAMLMPGQLRGVGSGYSAQWYDGTTSVANYLANGGLSTASGVSLSTTQTFAAYLGAAGYITAGTFFDVPWASLSQCALVDGSPNGLTYSDQIDNAAWTKDNSTVAANDVAAPDGTTTADALREDTTSGNHIARQAMTVSASALDMTLSFCIKAGTRSWAIVGISDFSAHAVAVYINLSTGALGSYAVSGTNVTNQRAFVTSLGSGWYRVNLVVRKSGSQTSMFAYVGAATGDGGSVYSGTASAKAIYLWRGAMAVSGVPFVPAQTTSSATTGSSQSSVVLNLKGLPVSTSGLLLAGDMVSSSGQINRVVAPLNSDASGCGSLICGTQWRGLVDNAAIIVNTPMCKMLLNPDSVDIDTLPGQFSPVTLELVEAID